jgi:hypothetical protein
MLSLSLSFSVREDRQNPAVPIVYSAWYPESLISGALVVKLSDERMIAASDSAGIAGVFGMSFWEKQNF